MQDDEENVQGTEEDMQEEATDHFQSMLARKHKTAKSKHMVRKNDQKWEKVQVYRNTINHRNPNDVIIGQRCPMRKSGTNIKIPY